MAQTSTTCPKCGYPSTDPEICDACGVIFSKIQDRDLSRPEDIHRDENFSAYEDIQPERSGSILKMLIWLLILVALGFGAYRTFSTKRPMGPEQMVKAHREVVEGTRDVFLLGKPETHRSDLLALRMKARDLSPKLVKMQKTATDQTNHARLAALAEANFILQQVLKMPPPELQKALDRADTDPLSVVEQQLEFAETGTSTPLKRAASQTTDSIAQAYDFTGGGLSRFFSGDVSPKPAEQAGADEAETLERAKREAGRFLPATPTRTPVPRPQVEAGAIGTVMKLTSANFTAEVSNGVYMVEFTAAWSQPSKKLGPIVDGLASEYAGRARFGRLDVEAHRRVADRYSVNSVPAVYVFKEGQPVGRVQGVSTREALKAMLDAHL